MYDHTHRKARDPVRSPQVKLMRAGLVVGSVTTSEYLVLYVFFAPLYTFLTLVFRGVGMPCPDGPANPMLARDPGLPVWSRWCHNLYRFVISWSCNPNLLPSQPPQNGRQSFGLQIETELRAQ